MEKLPYDKNGQKAERIHRQRLKFFCGEVAAAIIVFGSPIALLVIGSFIGLK